MHRKGYLPIYINQFRSYQPININTVRHAPDTTRHHQTCIRHNQTPPDMHQTMSDRLAVVLWWFIELYSWSRFFLPTGERANEGNPRGPRGPKKHPVYFKLLETYIWAEYWERSAKNLTWTSKKVFYLQDRWHFSTLQQLSWGRCYGWCQFMWAIDGGSDSLLL